MKYSIILLLLAFTQPLSAQKYELGFNGGLSSNSAPKDMQYHLGELNFRRTVSKALNVRGAYLLGKWRFGIGAELIRLEYQVHGKSVFQGCIYSVYINPANPVIDYNPIVEFNEKEIIAKNALPIRLFIDRMIAVRKCELYGGGYFGYVFMTEISPRTRGDIAPFWFTGYGHGIIAGIQAGATYPVTKRVGINAEMNSGHMWSKHERLGKYNTVLSSGTLGVRYRL